MECPYLEPGRVARFCNASISLMIPSVEESSCYCTTEEHYRCPMLVSHILRGGAARLC